MENEQGDKKAQENLLNNIPEIVNVEDNSKLIQQVKEEEAYGVMKSMNPDEAPRARWTLNTFLSLSLVYN
jgi:hypothetical protein